MGRKFPNSVNRASGSRDWDSERMSKATRQLQNELLVLMAQDGEAAAWDELVARWQKPLWRHACRLTGRAEAAWDVMQEAWLGMVRGLAKLDDPKGFRAWAYRITTRRAVDWVRSRQRDRRGQDILETAGRPSESPDESDATDSASDVRAALAKIDLSHRVVLTLYYLDELGINEIADVLSIPAGTVKSRLHHGRDELRRHLDPHGDQS